MEKLFIILILYILIIIIIIIILIGEEFIKKVNHIDELEPVFDISPLTQNMMASDGWKYLLVVSKNLGQSRVKVIIPSHTISERLATISFNDTKNESKSSSKLKINTLIIDDSLTTCKSLSRLLDKTGHDADYEADPMSVLNMNLSSYNIILCDIHMPHLNGLDLCRAVRGILYYNVVIIIIIIIIMIIIMIIRISP